MGNSEKKMYLCKSFFASVVEKRGDKRGQIFRVNHQAPVVQSIKRLCIYFALESYDTVHLNGKVCS